MSVDTVPAPPESMAKLPRDQRGRPVPFAASWSSEHWASIRTDPIVNRRAVFSAGRQGRGRPVLGVLNEERQRKAMVLGLCQVCAGRLGRDQWIPDSVATGSAELDGDPAVYPVTTEPPCCFECARWSLLACPGLRKATGLWRIINGERLLQLVDPSRAPAGHAGRFGGDDPAVRARLGEIARRTGGVVGYVKLAITDRRFFPADTL